MTDKYKQLRDALDAGPTPGPWQVSAGAVDNPRLIVENDISLPVCAMSLRGVQGDTRRMEANAILIAAAHPETIRALLAERDALREALQKVRPVIAADRQALLDTHGDGEEIPATDELGTLGLHEYDGALHVIDAALAQHQGEKHGDQ